MPPWAPSIQHGCCVYFNLDATRRSQTAAIPEVTASCIATPGLGNLTNQTTAERISKASATAPIREEQLLFHRTR